MDPETSDTVVEYAIKISSTRKENDRSLTRPDFKRHQIETIKKRLERMREIRNMRKIDETVWKKLAEVLFNNHSLTNVIYLLCLDFGENLTSLDIEYEEIHSIPAVDQNNDEDINPLEPNLIKLFVNWSF
jgi:hypothetical protein